MSTIQIRIDQKVKKEANDIFNKLGIDMTTAIKMFLIRVIRQKGIPFNITLATDEELKNFHRLSEKSFELWNNPKDDEYQKFYKQEK